MNEPFNDLMFYPFNNTLVVISDSELREMRRYNALQEIESLERRADHYRSALLKLEEKISSYKEAIAQLEPETTKSNETK